MSNALAAQRPLPGMWVAYTLPDKRTVYADPNTQRVQNSVARPEEVVASVYIRPGAPANIGDLEHLVLTGFVEIEGDLLAVVRTAHLVGLYVPGTESYSNPHRVKDKVAMNLAKEAYDHMYDTNEPTNEREGTNRRGISAALQAAHAVSQAAVEREKARAAAAEVEALQATKREAIKADPKGYFRDIETRRQIADQNVHKGLIRAAERKLPDKDELRSKGRGQGATQGAIAGGILGGTAGLLRAANIRGAGSETALRHMVALGVPAALVGAGVGALRGSHNADKAHKAYTREKEDAAKELEIRERMAKLKKR